MRRVKVILLTLIMVMTFVWMPINFAVAGSLTLSLSPMLEKIILAPGETYRSSFKVVNPESSDITVSYSAEVGSYSVMTDVGEGEYGGVDTVSVSNYNQIMDWITLEKTEGAVDPGESDVIAFTIDVPENAPAGGQYATIVVKNTTETEKDGTGNVQIESKIAIAYSIFAEISGDYKKNGTILENNVPSFLLNNTLDTESMVRNDGNVHTDASYVLQVWPLFSDEELCTNEEDPSTELVLPETQKYHSESCNLPSMGIFRAKQTVKIFGEESIVEKTIIVCPIWLLFLIIFIIVVLIIWIVMRVRARGKNSGKKSEKKAEG